MNLRLFLLVLILLAGCGPAAQPVTPTITEAPIELPSATPRPSVTPRPTYTATTDPTAAGATAAAEATAATPDPGATAGAAQPPAAGQPAAGKAPEQYTYLGQSIPDRTQFLPNRVVTITWTVRNSGTVGWTKDYVLRYFAGPEPDQSAYPFNKDVPVNDTINFTVTFTTPAAPGDYDLWFKLTNNAGQNFGDLDFLFTVSNTPSAATSTPAQ